MLSTVCDGVPAIDGCVVDETGAPLVGAKVHVDSAEPNGAVSDQQGCSYCFRGHKHFKDEVPFLVDVAVHQPNLGTITAQGERCVLVRLRREAEYSTLEQALAAGPACRK